MKLRCKASTQDFWNGQTYVQFKNGEYEASPQEAEHLVKCLGVEIVEEACPPPASTPSKRGRGKKK